MTFTARVRNGRLILDEPTSLADGAEVQLVLLENEMDADLQAEVQAAVDDAEADIDAGRVVDETEMWARLRAIT